MYYKLPVKERMDLMRSYKKTNKDMSYSDMVNDYNTSYQRFGNGGKVEFNSGGETHIVYKKESPTGNGKGVEGHIMVNHPTKDKGKWDTIDLTAITNYDVKTIQEGIASTKQWHKENPEYAYGGMHQFDNGGKMPKKEINLNIKNQEFNSPVSTWNENLDWQGEKYNDVGLNFNKKNLNIGIGNYVPRSTFEKTGNINPYLNVSYDLNDRNSIGGNFSKDYNGVSFIRKFENGGIQRFDNGGIKKEVRSTTDNTNVAKPYFPNPDNTNMDPRKIPQSGMVVDKRTNQAYYFGDDGDTGTFPVLTAKNPEANKNTYSLSQLAKNSNLRSTPKGYYMVEKESKYKSKDNMQHYKGLMRSLNPIEAYGESKPKASDLALHLTFTDPGNPKVFKNREQLYNQTPQKRYASYGCVNCQEPSYRAFNKAVPESDTLMMLDSNDPKDLRLLKQAQSRIKTKIKD